MVFTISKRVTVTVSEENEKTHVWKQVLYVFLASLPFFTHGVETTELTASVHSGHFIPSIGVVPWTTTSLILAAVASAPVCCWLVERWGRKGGVYLISLIQGASCIPLFLPHTEYSVIILHILAGVSSAGLFTVLPAYIREISDDSIRGLTLSVPTVMVTLGYLTHLVQDMEAQMFLLVALVVTQFLALLLLVESPSYLVRIGKDQSARKNLAKLYCTLEDGPFVHKEVARIKDESERVKAKGAHNLWRILKNPLYRDITKIGLVLNTTIVLSGSIVFLEQDKALVQLRSPVDPTQSLVLGGLATGSLLSLVLVKLIDRKYVLTIFYSVAVLSLGVLGVFTQVDLTVASFRWLPVGALATLICAYSVIWSLQTVVTAEMLNIEIRSKILALLFIYGQLLKLLHVHTFQYVEEYMGIYTAFYVFSCVNMFGGVYCIFMMPQMEGKNIKQIERQMKRVPLLKFNTTPANKI